MGQMEAAEEELARLRDQRQNIGPKWWRTVKNHLELFHEEAFQQLDTARAFQSSGFQHAGSGTQWRVGDVLSAKDNNKQGKFHESTIIKIKKSKLLVHYNGLSMPDEWIPMTATSRLRPHSSHREVDHADGFKTVGRGGKNLEDDYLWRRWLAGSSPDTKLLVSNVGGLPLWQLSKLEREELKQQWQEEVVACYVFR
jgi:hypothetical protein